MANSPAAALEDLKAEAARLQGLAASRMMPQCVQCVLATAIYSSKDDCNWNLRVAAFRASARATVYRSSGFNGDHPSCVSLRGALG